jgi:isoleucyl-tRNA synthetase
MIDKALEANMKTVVDIVVLGRAARNGSNIKNRQPLNALYVKCDNVLDSFYSDIIRDELNVKAVEFVDDMSELSSYSFKPNLKTVGPKFGKLLGQIRGALQAEDFDGNKAMDELKSTGAVHFTFGDTEVALAEEDLLIEVKQKEGYFSIADNGITAALDLNLTEELIEEGFVREIVSKIQTMRKDSGLEVMDNINIYVSGNAKVVAIAEKNAAEIMGETLGKSLTNAENENAKEWDINGKKVKIAVEKI